jgi:hypothetical protein
MEVPLPPAFDDRTALEQIIGAVVVPMVFGILTGFALGWNAVLYYVLVGPIAIAGGFYGGMEHRGAEDGIVRGAMSGLVFGSFILLGLEILNTDPEAYLGKPQAGLAITTAIGGAILGGLGGAYRARHERSPAASA